MRTEIKIRLEDRMDVDLADRELDNIGIEVVETVFNCLTVNCEKETVFDTIADIEDCFMENEIQFESVKEQELI